MTRRVAIYARYSSDRQKPTSIDDQLSLGRKFCEERGWTVVAEHADAEMTGKNNRRPGLQALRQDVRKGGIDIVLVEAIDRLTRRVVDALTEFEMFEFRGVQFHSIAEGPQDFMKVLMLGYGAQLHSQSIAVHTERGRQAALETRKRVHSLAYGYRRKECETGVNREIDPEQAEIVRRIFRETAEGKSATAIVKGLNRDGIPSPQGSKWSESVLRGNISRNDGLLRNTLYIGIARLGQTHRQDDPETGKRKVTTTPEKVIEVSIPKLRIVPQEDWDAAQARILESAEKAKAAGNARAAHRTRYLLSGLMVCDCCGAPYVICGKTRYGCRGNRDGSCTNKVTIRRDRIETRVFNRLRKELLTQELTEVFEAAIQAERKALRKGDPDQPVKRLRKQHKELKKKLEYYFRAIEDGMLFEEVKDRMSEIKAGIAETDRKLAAAEAETREAKAPPPDPVVAYHEVLRRLEELLCHPDFVHQAHEHLDALIHRITLRPDLTAPDGMAAEILWDLGTLLSAGGYGAAWADRFRSNRQLTVGSGGSAPASVLPVLRRQFGKQCAHMGDGRLARQGRRVAAIVVACDTGFRTLGLHALNDGCC